MDEVKEALRNRYSHIHPLIFFRSSEYAKTNGELFDILDSMPAEMPVIWDHDNRRWVEDDLLQSKNLEKPNV